MSDATTPTIPVEVLEQVQPNGTLVDVREAREYADAHVPGAVLMPMGQLPSRLTELDRAKPVFVICASGNRSASMTDLLRAHGLEAYSVTGGTSAWQRSGRPIEGGL